MLRPNSPCDMGIDLRRTQGERTRYTPPVGFGQRRYAREIRKETQVQRITLAQIIASGTTTLRVACLCCSRKGKYSVPRLVAQHCPALDLGALKALLSQDCPKRLESMMDPCGIYFPDRLEMEKRVSRL